MERPITRPSTPPSPLVKGTLATKKLGIGQVASEEESTIVDPTNIDRIKIKNPITSVFSNK
jgi:hypothetical protein